MKTTVAILTVALLAVSNLARGQFAPGAPPAAGGEMQSGEQLPYAPQPYAPRSPLPPVTPEATSRPASWPGGPMAPPAAELELTDEESLSPWLKPRGGVPDKFTGTEVIARIGTEVILASDVMGGVEEAVAKALAAQQIQESQAPQLRHMMMRQRLENLVDTKMLLIEARREIPKENMPKIEKKVKQIYDEEQIPKLIDGKKIKSRTELFKAMRDAGTSLEEQQRQFLERSLAAQYIHKKIGDEKEITHEDMLAYYREHLTDYETAPRARWEQVAAWSANYPSKGEAYAKIAGWGNEIFQGAPLADIARKHSDDFSSENGGLHDWTTQGSLASEVLDKAIFVLPVGQLSPILEDATGFHIVRVVERQDLQRKPFGEMQAEIKKKIKAEREGVAMKKYLADMRKRVKVWTIFDDMPELAQEPDAGPVR